jgi:predicted DNA-binding protein
MPEKDEKPWTLTIRLPREMEARIRRLASERLVQPSVVVRQLVKERLDEMEREEARRQ